MSRRATELLQEAIEDGLGAEAGDDALRQIVRTQRLEAVSWERVSLEVFLKSGVKVTGQTLINWFPEYNKPADEIAADQAAAETSTTT